MANIVDLFNSALGNLANLNNTTYILFFLIGMVIYSMFVFNFYRFLARRDIFEFDLRQYGNFRIPFFAMFFKVILYILEYLLILPILIFFWFVVLALILTFLSEIKDINGILVVSMVLVAAVRVTAYYNEDLSKDLAKLLPFSLLAFFLINNLGSFSIQGSFEVLKSSLGVFDVILSYLILVIALEFILRIIYVIVSLFKGENVLTTSLERYEE